MAGNWNRIKNIDWSKKYGKLSAVTTNHLLVNAILALAYPIILGKTRAQKTIEFEKKLGGGDYAKAWQIVETEGPKNIIKKMVKK